MADRVFSYNDQYYCHRIPNSDQRCQNAHSRTVVTIVLASDVKHARHELGKPSVDQVIKNYKVHAKECSDT